MTNTFFRISLSALLGFCASSALADEKPAEADYQSLSFTNIKGGKITPLHSKKGKPVVVIFIATDCPIANSYVPELNRIHEEFSKKGVQITLVHVDSDLTDEKAKEHAVDYALKPIVVVDRKHQLVAVTKATMTPEAAVYDGKGKLIYIGRINNQYSGYGDRRANVTEHNLRDAITAALAGKTVPKPKVEAIGCFIPDL